MTTAKKNTAATPAATKADAPAVPSLAKAKADKLRGYCERFVKAEGDRLTIADGQRNDLIAMAKLGDFAACWPIVEEALGSLWNSEGAMRVTKSLMGRFWKVASNGLDFPAVDGPKGWQAYAKGELAELLEAEGLKTVRERSPQAPDGSDVAEGAAEARTIAKGADTLADVLSVMAEMANRAAVLAGDNRTMLAVLGNIKDDIDALQTLSK